MEFAPILVAIGVFFILSVFIVSCLWLFVTGIVKTFRRNWMLALVLLVLAFPIWCAWALVEIFTES